VAPKTEVAPVTRETPRNAEAKKRFVPPVARRCIPSIPFEGLELLSRNRRVASLATRKTLEKLGSDAVSTDWAVDNPGVLEYYPIQTVVFLLENLMKSGRGPGRMPSPRFAPYLQAVTMISTRSRGSASFASTQARAGAAPFGSHAVQTSFMASRKRISVTQIWA